MCFAPGLPSLPHSHTRILLQDSASETVWGMDIQPRHSGRRARTGPKRHRQLSVATGRVQNPFCTRSAKSQRWERSALSVREEVLVERDRVLTGVAIDSPPNRFSRQYAESGGV